MVGTIRYSANRYLGKLTFPAALSGVLHIDKRARTIMHRWNHSRRPLPPHTHTYLQSSEVPPHALTYLTTYSMCLVLRSHLLLLAPFIILLVIVLSNNLVCALSSYVCHICVPPAHRPSITSKFCYVTQAFIYPKESEPIDLQILLIILDKRISVFANLENCQRTKKSTVVSVRLFQVR